MLTSRDSGLRFVGLFSMNTLVPGLNTVKDPPSGRSISSIGIGKGDRSMSNSGTFGGGAGVVVE
jgi:hypothetical protein